MKKSKAKPTKPTRDLRPRVDGKPGKPNDVTWHSVFLAALAEVPDVTAAAKTAGVSPDTAYEHRKKFSDFEEQWQSALRQSRDAASGEVYRRAVIGWDEPVFQQGRQVGAVRRKSDQLLMFYLRAHCPEVYSEKSKVELSGRVAMTDAEVEAASADAERSFLLTLSAGLAGQRPKA